MSRGCKPRWNVFLPIYLLHCGVVWRLPNYRPTALWICRYPTDLTPVLPIKSSTSLHQFRSNWTVDLSLCLCGDFFKAEKRRRSSEANSGRLEAFLSQPMVWLSPTLVWKSPPLNLNSALCLQRLVCSDEAIIIHWSTMGQEEWASQAPGVTHGESQLFARANFHPRN